MDDITKTLSSLEHVTSTQARQAITGSRGSIGEAVSVQLALFTTAISMRFVEEVKTSMSDQTFVSRILDILHNARSVEELTSVLPVSVGCTKNQQFESVFRYSSDPVRLNNQLLDAIAKNIRLLLPTRSMTDRRVTSISGSSNSITSTTSYDQIVNSTNRSESTNTSIRREYGEIFSGGLDDDQGSEIPHQKQLPPRQEINIRVRRNVHEYLNENFSGGTVDEVVAELSKLLPQARVCEDITESSVRKNMKFSKEGTDSSIVLTLGVFPDLPAPRLPNVRFKHTEDTAKRGFSLICVDPRLERYAVINSTVDQARRKFTTAMQEIGMSIKTMTNSAPKNFHHVNTDFADSAAEVLCFAEWFCKNEQFNRDEFKQRVQLVKKQRMKSKRPNKVVKRKQRKNKTEKSGSRSHNSGPAHDILKECNLVGDDNSSDEFSAGQTE